MILPRAGTRAMSANVWIDPQGRLWLFWGQSVGLQDGRFGVWAIVTDDPDAAEPKWSAPRRLGDGILLNKPTVFENGDWLLPASVWKADNSINVLASSDQGKTFHSAARRTLPEANTRGPDEPMIVERKDGSLWMMVRMQGLAETHFQRWRQDLDSRRNDHDQAYHLAILPPAAEIRRTAAREARPAR